MSAPDGKKELWFIGPITAQDAEQVEALAPQLAKKKLEYELNPEFHIASPGGDLEAAMRIGRVLRKNRYRVLVLMPIERADGIKSDGVCASACVFVLAGGVERFLISPPSKVAIHRPYADNLSDSSMELSEERYRRMRKQVADYFAEMNIHPSLAEDMLSISPTASKVLSGDELRRYRLFGVDPAWEELRTIESAKRWGLSPKEYRQRQNRVERECTNNSPAPWIECNTAIMKGIR